MSTINEKQELFLQKLNKGRKKDGTPYTRGEAYSFAYPGVKDNDVARKSASRLLKKDDVKARHEELRNEIKDLFHSHAEEAANTIFNVMRDNKTAADVKRKAAQDVLRMSELEPATKQEVDVSDRRVFKGLNDEDSFNELVTEAYKRINHPEND